jgi:hypothetical protein
VSSSSPQNGVTTTLSTLHYRYHGAKLQGGGRGLLGVGFGIKRTHFESGFSFQIDPHEPAKLSEFSCAFKFHCGSIRNRRSGSIFHGIQHTGAGGAATETIVVARWGRTGLQAGDWVMKGRATPWNYFWSGKWQPGLGNQFASFSSGAEFVVPRTALAFPNESALLNWIKASLGQRIYLPPP